MRSALSMDPLRRFMPTIGGLLFLATISTHQVSAQTGVIGRTVDPAARIGIVGVRVSAHDQRGREHGVTLTDSIGFFRLNLPPGEYLLRATFIGYAPAETRMIEFSENEQLEVLLQMSVRPLGMEPLVIVGSRTNAGRLKEYY
jgi:hypothetical protein